jgi:hypothetical protein
MPAKKTNKKTAASTAPAGPGLGKKFCPSCNALIGARSTTCPDCGFEFIPKSKKSDAASSNGEISETAFIKVLAGRGFDFQRLRNELTGEIVKDVKDPKIEKLGLKFGPVPKNADAIYVTQTTPQIQVAMSLDKFLEVAGIKP